MSKSWSSRIDRRALLVGMVAGTVVVMLGLALTHYGLCPPTYYGPFVPCEHYLFGVIPISGDALASAGGAFFLIGMIVLVVLWVLSYLRRSKAMV